MYLKLYEKIAFFLFPILLILCIISFIGFFYRGETILGLQTKLLEDKDKKIEIVLNQVKTSDKIGEQFETEKVKIQVQKEYITNVVEKIVEKPVYTSDCFDNIGLQFYNENIRSLNSTIESKSRVSETEGTK